MRDTADLCALPALDQASGCNPYSYGACCRQNEASIDPLQSRNIAGRMMEHSPAVPDGAHIVNQSCVEVGDIRVVLRTFESKHSHDVILDGGPEFRLGMLLKPSAAFRGSFIGAGMDSASDGLHPLCTPPDLALRCNVTSGLHRDIVVSFSKGRFARQTGHRGEFTRAELRTCLAIMDHNVTSTLRRLALELSSPGLASALMIEALGSSLIVDLFRQIVNSNVDEAKGYVTLSRRQQSLIRERANRDGPAPSINELAELCDLSGRQLIRLFKRATGRTLHEYVEEVRLERAVKLLSATSLPLKEVSYRLGFAAPSSFSIAFRRLTGSSPRTYRRAARTSLDSQLFASHSSEL